MAEDETGSTLQLAQELVGHLPKELKEMDNNLQSLILRAKAGQDPMAEIEIIDLLSAHATTRALMQAQINSQSGQKDITLGNDPFADTSRSVSVGLAGNPSWVPPSQKWICPENSCERWIFVIQEGGDPPTCEKHNVKMVRGNKKKG